MHYLRPIWHHSKPTDVPYFPNQLNPKPVSWVGLFCHFLQQTGSRSSNPQPLILSVDIDIHFLSHTKIDNDFGALNFTIVMTLEIYRFFANKVKYVLSSLETYLVHSTYLGTCALTDGKDVCCLQ